MILKDLMNWAEDRKLDKVPFDKQGHSQNVIEELCEMFGYEKEDCRAIAQSVTESIMDDAEEVSEHEEVDAIADNIVFCLTALRQKGYDTTKVLEQTYMEISSRTGAYCEKEKKWLKDTSPEAQAKWRKADYKDCKI